MGIVQSPGTTMSCPPSLVTTSHAVSSRSTCRKCKQTIEKGEMRVGVEAWVAGRSSMTWQHVGCFATSLDVEVVMKGATGTCKETKTKIEKGSVRTTVWSNTAKFYLSIAGVYVLSTAVSHAAGSSDVDQWCLEHIKGLSSIPEELQRNWLAGLKEKGMKSVAIASSPSSVATTISKTLRSGNRKKLKTKREEDELSDDDDESDASDESEEEGEDDDEYDDSDVEEVMPQKKVRKFVEA